jgi:TolB protein
MNADGSQPTRLTNLPTGTGDPYWSPDGKKIVFDSMPEGKEQVYIMNADGSAQTRLIQNTSTDFAGPLSPDGTRIAFQSDRDGNNEIYVMNVDGSKQTRLTNNSADDGHPVWQPKVSGTIAYPTAVPATIASATPLPSPTRIPSTATPAPPPGVYIIKIETDPSEPKQRQPVVFHVTFFNNIGAQANMRWYVRIFDLEKPNASFGETDKVDSQIPVGTSRFTSPANWKPGGGVPCKTFFARVTWIDPRGIQDYPKTGGGAFEHYFQICP